MYRLSPHIQVQPINVSVGEHKEEFGDLELILKAIFLFLHLKLYILLLDNLEDIMVCIRLLMGDTMGAVQ
jgi:hypothetical protein